MIKTQVERKIMWGDLDSLGIVFYPKYYEWIDGCSHLFFENLSLNLVELWKTRHLIFSLVKTSAEYLSPGRYHQEIIITTHVEKLEQKTITLNHLIEDKKTNKILIKGVEKRICMGVKDLENFNAQEIPEDIYQMLNLAL